jgi:uracil DNA glycosylase
VYIVACVLARFGYYNYNSNNMYKKMNETLKNINSNITSQDLKQITSDGHTLFNTVLQMKKHNETIKNRTN